MSGRPVRTQQVNADERVKRAFGIMNDIRSKLYRRLADYVLANEGRMRAESLSEDTYSFTLQQMEDQFLNKLNVVERAVAELARSEQQEGQPTTTTYETIEIVAKREELPQKIADALAEHGESDFLDMSVLRADDKHAEVILVLAREEPAGEIVEVEEKSEPAAEAAPEPKAESKSEGEDRGETDDIL